MPEPTLDDLRTVLRDRAEGALIPVVPLAHLEDRVTDHRRRFRRRLAGATIAAAVAAVTVAVVAPNLGSDHSGDEQPPASDSPTSPSTPRLEQGPPPKVAYTVGHELRYPGAGGEVTIDLGGEPSGLRQVGKIVMVTINGNHVKVFRLGDDNGDILEAPAAGDGVLSPDGHYAAWQRPGSGKAVVVVSRTDGEEADRFMTFPKAPSCCDNPFTLVGITADGRLIAWMGAYMETWVWDFADDADAVTEVSGVTNPDPPAGTDGGPGIPRQVVGNRLVVEYDGGAGTGIGPIGADGRWHPEQPDPDHGTPTFGGRALFSPDGTRVAYLGQDGLWLYVGATSYQLDPGISADLLESSDWRFEDEDSLLISTVPDEQHRVDVIRCTLETRLDNPPAGRCERAARVHGNVLLPG